MAEFLARIGAVIFEEADVLDARIALEVHDAFGGQAQELSDLIVTGIPQMAVMPGIFHQNFVSAHRAHAIINAIPMPASFTLNVVERCGMHHRSR